MIAKLKGQLKHSPLLVESHKTLSRHFRGLLFRVSPALPAHYNYLSKRGRLPNLKTPKTFDEKLLWLMLYWKHPLKARCADKYAVRDYVAQSGFSDLLLPLIGVYNSPDEVPFSALPESFALKCTHGCGFNILCKDKDALDWRGAQRKLKQWMRRDISRVNGEIHYSEIEPRIVCEPFLCTGGGAVPNDYKMFCFGGKVHCTMACTGRDAAEGPSFAFYDAEWKNKLPYNKTYSLSTNSVSAPACYGRMVEAAEALSGPFPFVRVDFYDIQGKAIFGELTFTPSGCVDPGYTDIGQEKLGELVTLPEKRIERAS